MKVSILINILVPNYNVDEPNMYNHNYKQFVNNNGINFELNSLFNNKTNQNNIYYNSKYQ